MRKNILVLSFAGIFFVQFGCAKRIAISYDQIEKDILVRIKTNSGAFYNGIIKAKQPTFVILQTNKNKDSLSKIARNNINNIFSVPPTYDYQHKVISEWEIKENQPLKNTLLYTTGGAGLSFGISFFIGSLIHRNMSNSKKGELIQWTTTGIGTAIGTLFFARAGKNKDRRASITEIRERRYAIAQKEIAIQKARREKVQAELERVKKQRTRQETERKRLIERLKVREKRHKENEPK